MDVSLSCDAATLPRRIYSCCEQVYDCTISRQTVTCSILKQGQLAKFYLQKLFRNMAQDPQCAISGIIDFWLARQAYKLPYGGVIA